MSHDLLVDPIKTDEPSLLEGINQAPLGRTEESFTARIADFDTLSESLDYAALAKTGMNFNNARGHCDFAMRYAKIREQALELAKKLLGLGLLRGERVGVVADMHPDFICTFFACQYAGLVAVPLPVITGLGGRLGYEAQLKAILENSKTRIALGPSEYHESISKAAEGTDVEFIMTVSSLAEKVSFDGDLEPLGPNEISHIQFSSGSTRYPLGIEISQKSVMANARSIASDALNITHKDRVASWLPFYHDMGLIGCLIVPVTCQLTVDYLYTDSFARRPVQWLRMISDNRCTISFSPTFGYDVCARRMKGKSEENLDLSMWRVAGIGGDMIQHDVMDHFAQTLECYGFKAEALVPSYGLAEATLAFSFQTLNTGVTVDVIDKKLLTERAIAKSCDVNGSVPDSSTVRTFASCGKPMPGYQLQIRSENGSELPERNIGGVFIKGHSLMSGYHNNKEATDNSIDKDGWLDTGDMGYVADGILYITGRRKDMIIINGRNIWPQDLEWHAEKNVKSLRSRDAAAFALIGPDAKEEAVVLIQCRTLDQEAQEQLVKEVRSVVFTNTGIDCRVELIPQRSLPFTTSGKLRRNMAKNLWLQGAYSMKAGASQNVESGAGLLRS